MAVDFDLGRKQIRVEKVYSKPVLSPLLGSEAPCCGGGLSGNCLLIIHFMFKTTRKSNIFHFSKILNTSPPNFYPRIKNIRKIIHKFSKKYWIKDSNLI